MLRQSPNCNGSFPHTLGLPKDQLEGGLMNQFEGRAGKGVLDTVPFLLQAYFGEGLKSKMSPPRIPASKQNLLQETKQFVVNDTLFSKVLMTHLCLLRYQELLNILSACAVFYVCNFSLYSKVIQGLPYK